MKISISYPPIINKYGQKAMVSQNRNVQYFKKPTYLLPVIHAQAASILKKNGHEVIWDDGNAEEKSYESWLKDLVNISPEIIILESTHFFISSRSVFSVGSYSITCDNA